MTGYKFSDFSMGKSYKQDFFITEEIGKEFAKVSQDLNPIHISDDYAKTSRFGKKIVHGMLLGSYISSILGTKFPGEGCIYLKQELVFLRPVYYNDIVTIEMKVIDILLEKKRVVIETSGYNQDNIQVIAGKATVLPRED